MYGGYANSDSGSASATGNSVTITGGAVATGGGAVYGGYANSDSGSASATGNSVTITGGTVATGTGYGYVSGGYAYSVSSSASATGNSVTITGGTVATEGNVFGGSAHSDSGSASATGNSFTITGGTVATGAGRGVLGGYAHSDSGTASATGNSVTITGGTVATGVDGSVYGGYAASISGTASASATGNSVTITGGTVATGTGGSVFGGYAHSDSGTASATGNSVTITGGTVGNITGGYAYSGSGTREAINNTVTISNSPNLSASTLRGGQLAGSATTGDAFSGNTLNVVTYTGSPIVGASDFQYYNLILPAAMGAGATALTATGAVTLGDGAGKSSTLSVGMMGGGKVMQAGESVTLIRAGTLSGSATNENSLVQARKGLSLLYGLQLNKVVNIITATVQGKPRVNPQTKALAEGRAAGMAFTTQGADLIAGAGLSAAQAATRGAGSGKTAGGTSGSLAAFSAFQGGSSRYNTGSHVDVDGFSLMTGLGWNKNTSYGNLLLGAFFEFGLGTYDTYNSFSNSATVNGGGDTRYTGGGLLGRMEFPLGSNAGSTSSSLLYVEGSVRAGWAETDFSSSDLRDITGQHAEYDSSAMYYGAHLGLGTVWNLTETLNLDLYTKYFWTRQGSDSVTVVGDPIHFKTTDSHRWRGGARLGYDYFTEDGTRLTPYFGAAYEHEFDGKAKATTYGYAIDAPDVTGGTGIGELGLSFSPASENGVTFDLGVQGYTGLREGVTGSFKVSFVF